MRPTLTVPHDFRRGGIHELLNSLSSIEWSGPRGFSAPTIGDPASCDTALVTPDVRTPAESHLWGIVHDGRVRTFPLVKRARGFYLEWHPYWISFRFPVKLFLDILLDALSPPTKVTWFAEVIFAGQVFLLCVMSCLSVETG